MTDPLSVDQRLRMVEAAIDVQAEILTNIQAELIESDRLSNSVERLGDGASELGAALLQVDRNQQALTRLGKQLEDVAESAVTQDDLALQEERKHREWLARRRRTRLRVGLSALLALLVGGVAVSAVLTYQQDKQANMARVCEYRNDQTALIVDILRGSMARVPANSTDPRVVQMRENIARFEALIIDCETLR